jgi:alpha-L-rhamnosidase
MFKAQMFEPVSKLRVLSAKMITEPQPGIYVIDFGQNTAAIARMRVKGTKGQNVTLLHGEALNHAPYGDGSAGDSDRVYRGNLRKALARDTYLLRGAAETAAMDASSGGYETYEPTFTQHGFRYLEIHGLGYKPALSDLQSVELHSSVRDAGTIHTSSALLNAIQQACVWTAKSNLMSIPTDCCQRNERRGWMGDAAIGSGEQYYRKQLLSCRMYSYERKNNRFFMNRPKRRSMCDFKCGNDSELYIYTAESVVVIVMFTY